MPLTKKGSTLLVTLMFIAIFSLLAQQLYHASMLNSDLDESLILREQAKTLALSGISLAIAQLSVDEADDGEKKQEDNEPHAQEKKFLRRILPHLNRLQSFKLSQKSEGIDGTIDICISSEHGKLNINKGFDFEKGSFTDEYELLLEQLVLNSPRGEILKQITDYLAQRKKPLDDISQLSQVKSLEGLALDYYPPREGRDGGKPKKGLLALRDIFTIWTDDVKLEPWLLSSSLTRILSLRAPEHDDPRKRQKMFEHAIDNFTPHLGASWRSNWNVLQPLYDKNLELNEDLSLLFTQEFAPEVYSVLSWGKIRNIEQKLCAILVRIKSNTKADDLKKTKTESRYIVKRIFWL